MSNNAKRDRTIGAYFAAAFVAFLTLVVTYSEMLPVVLDRGRDPLVFVAVAADSLK